MQALPPRSPRLPPLDSPRVGSPRVLSPRVHRPRPTTSSAQVRGGGRLFIQSPLSGYTEAEMIREAQIRLEHNKQRQRLKAMLEPASNGGHMVKMNELLLACKLAKVPMDADRLVSTPDVGMVRNERCAALVGGRAGPPERPLPATPQPFACVSPAIATLSLLPLFPQWAMACAAIATLKPKSLFRPPRALVLPLLLFLF